jgi:hypothetical protein
MNPAERSTMDQAAQNPNLRPNLDLTDFDPNADRLREECGVFGIFGHPDAAAITALGLHALQHRGQEAAGIVSYDAATSPTALRFGSSSCAKAR